MEGSKISQDELVEKLKQQVALENIELLLTVSLLHTSHRYCALLHHFYSRITFSIRPFYECFNIVFPVCEVIECSMHYQNDLTHW